MLINNKERDVYICEPTNVFPGAYKVYVQSAEDFDYLNRERLFTLLKEQGILYSNRDHDKMHGFNDINIMGVNEALDAQSNKLSHIWLGISRQMVDLQVLPEVAMKLEKETHIQYAQRILNTVVPFIEDSKNCDAKEMYRWY